MSLTVARYAGPARHAFTLAVARFRSAVSTLSRTSCTPQTHTARTLHNFSYISTVASVSFVLALFSSFSFEIECQT